MRVAKEAAGSFRSPDAFAQPFCPGLCIAMVASGRYLDATPPGIEGVVRPFDARIFSHDDQLMLGGTILYAYDRSGRALLGGGCNG